MNARSLGAFPGMPASPFLGSVATHAGLVTAHELRTNYRAIYRNVYLPNDIALTPILRAQAAWLFAGPEAVLCGVSAAAVHGIEWLDVQAPAEIVRTNCHSPDRLRVRSYCLAPDDVCQVDGMRVTTVARTILDLGRLLPRDEAVPILDALLNKSGIDPDEVWKLAEANRGIRGIDRLRVSLAQADGGAESPLETRTRLQLWNMGIPGLRTQIPFHDQWGQVWTRAAMGWPRLKVAVECDEEKDSVGYRTWVHSHTAELESYGWTVVWVTESMVSGPGSFVERVRRKLLTAQRTLDGSATL
ncbi:type IV toxin-antitoxin system AbiEi family antitoxin domain-containing protein [Mycolicibacterium setense]|uniref:type IV toxin-antitoxin system AbiEi family antitoxin domain-containing protein n=1 Tax=Mycolicibacterium setense TaxID=431269 RepID=UPI001F40DBB3|nr:hypothetical protein [Mycolicibacterium setense]